VGRVDGVDLVDGVDIEDQVVAAVLYLRKSVCICGYSLTAAITRKGGGEIGLGVGCVGGRFGFFYSFYKETGVEPAP